MKYGCFQEEFRAEKDWSALVLCTNDRVIALQVRSELAALLPYAEPVYVRESVQAEVEELQNRVKELEMELGIYRQTLKDMVSNR